jgi:hypothetical protein
MGLTSFFQNYYKSIQCNHLSGDRVLDIQEQRFRRLLHYAVNHSGLA